jgi:kumamolisin
MDAASNHVVVPGSEPKPAAGLRMVGPVDAQKTLRVTVYLRPKPDEAEPGVAQSLASGRGYLTHEEFEKRFGADPQDLEVIENFARRHGLKVEAINPARRTVELSGPAGAFSEAFAVGIQHWEGPGGIYHRPDGPVRVPPELAPIVTGVFGLDSTPVASPRD